MSDRNHTDPLRLTRRAVLAAAGAWAVEGKASLAPYRTPYKYGRLVLGADPRAAACDQRAVDCPFVFHYKGRFHMTYLGLDGTGYQTGLASSEDLVNWTRLGCILQRDPSNPVTKYNIALNWILRDSRIRSDGDERGMLVYGYKFRPVLAAGAR